MGLAGLVRIAAVTIDGGGGIGGASVVAALASVAVDLLPVHKINYGNLFFIDIVDVGSLQCCQTATSVHRLRWVSVAVAGCPEAMCLFQGFGELSVRCGFGI